MHYRTPKERPPMKKLLSSVGLAIAVAMICLAGCNLYFGSNSNGNNGPGGEGNPPGFACGMDVNCAAGCFCANGICTEGGFCGGDKDCGTGFHCDTSRSSCIPNPACGGNEACAQGSMCDNGGCVATCKCANDADAVKQGFGWCDEARSTCMAGTDPAGTCLEALTCTTAPPQCPTGQVALVKNGCFTGSCREIAACEGTPVCKQLQHQEDCVTRAADCAVVTTGHNCRRQDNTPCQSGDTEPVCHCESYTFSGCADISPPTPPVIFQ
jgi:hypothetical protein